MGRPRRGVASSAGSPSTRPARESRPPTQRTARRPASPTRDAFEFNEPDHEIAVSMALPQQATPKGQGRGRARQDTPAGSGKKATRSRAPASPVPTSSTRRLSTASHTPPRLGGDLSSSSAHNSLSPLPLDLPESGSERQSTPSPTDVWRRVLKKDPARLVAPLSNAVRGELDMALAASPMQRKKRSLSPSTASPARAGQQSLNGRSHADHASAASESPLKRRRRNSPSPAPRSSAASPARGRRSSRLEHESRKSMREAATDDEDEEEKENSVARGRAGKTRDPSPSVTSSPTKSRGKTRVAPYEADPGDRMARMKSFFDDLDAQPMESLMEFRPQR